MESGGTLKTGPTDKIKKMRVCGRVRDILIVEYQHVVLVTESVPPTRPRYVGGMLAIQIVVRPLSHNQTHGSCVPHIRKLVGYLERLSKFLFTYYAHTY